MNYEWAPSECADERFPMQIVRGDFIFPDDQRLYIPDQKVIHNGWGEYNSSHVVGDPEKPLPDRMEISWFSFTENRFYSGMFQLGIDDLEAKFAEGFAHPDTGEPTTYNRILVGLAPEGGVTVWLGGYGVLRLFRLAQAVFAEIPWQEILDNDDVSRDEYVRMVLEESLGEPGYQQFLEHGIPQGWWNRLRTRFNWRFDVAGVEATQIWIRTIDGQREFTNLQRDRGGFTNGQLPKLVELEWKNPRGKRYRATLKFDQQEVLSAFAKMATVAGEDAIVVVFEASSAPAGVVVSLRAANSILNLNRIDCQVRLS